jgi:hypothetical protein
MTSLAVSVSVDARGPSGLYIISDSRITWGNADILWDAGRKTFSSRRTADVFGYCGDAFFPPMIIGQVIEQSDAGVLLPADAHPKTRHDRIIGAFRRAMQRRINAPMQSFSLFHGSRECELMRSRFFLWETRYDVTRDQWEDIEHCISETQSYLAHIDGTGRASIEKRGMHWDKSTSKGTSRAGMWAFCEALQSGRDRFSGGPPQLVGIWRKGPAQNFGMLWHGKAYIAGLEVCGELDWQAVSWFNHLFERCDGRTGRRLKSAKSHIKPVA